MQGDQQLMDVERVLKTARSVRRNLDFDRPVTQEDLYAAIDVAVQAPTGLIGEGWRFLIVTEPAKKSAIAELYGETLTQLMAERGLPLKASHQSLVARLHEMPCLIFVCAVGVPPEDVSGQVGFYGSILPAAWSLMLALRARDIGTTWTSLLCARADEVAKILDIPKGATQTVMLPAGYTKNAVLKPADRQAAAEVTFWNGWNQGQ
jgi:nitroreductase